MNAALVAVCRRRRVVPLSLLFAAGLCVACDTDDIADEGGPRMIVG